jgi:hypothetical protein
MTKPTSLAAEAVLPLHIYLQRRVQELADVTNVKIAQAIGYDKPNVVAMILNGSMKVPINKVSELARALHIDKLWLLRRSMTEYTPDGWSVIEKIVGSSRLTTANETAVLQFIRTALADEEVELMEDDEFVRAFTRDITLAIDRHLRRTLAVRRGDRPRFSATSEDTKAAMLALLRSQAEDRAKLLSEADRAGRPTR